MIPRPMSEFPFPKEAFNYHAEKYLFYTEKFGWQPGQCILVDDGITKYYYKLSEGSGSQATHWMELPPDPAKNLQEFRFSTKLYDVYDGKAKEITVEIVGDSHGVCVYAEGYGNTMMDPGYACVVHLENCGGKFMADLFTDFENEEPTHRIGFEGARESLRTPHESNEKEDSAIIDPT